MLKARNSFFSESNMNSQVISNPTPMPMYQNYNFPQGQMQSQSASNSFYSGPVMGGYNQNYNQGMPSNGNTTFNTYNNFDEYDNRLAKIERSINRLDSRITKLENQMQITTDDLNSSMYMV